MHNQHSFNNAGFSTNARDLMIANFPGLAGRIREAFRESPTFRDLCEDYQLVVSRQSKLVDKQSDGKSSTDAILHRLKRDLEQEMFNYFKSSNR